MKKILVIIFILIAFNSQCKFFKGFSFGTSFSARSSQSSGIYDYEIAVEFDKPDLIYLEIEKERENGQEYYNHEFKLTYLLPYLVSNARWMDIESNDIDLKQIDVRGVYSKYNLGIAQQWMDNIPDTKLVAGISYKHKLLMIVGFELAQDFYTQNFKDYDTETLFKISVDIYFFAVYWRSTVKNYGNLNWKTKMGLRVKL